jgi:two-component system, OmpR family, response regulator
MTDTAVATLASPILIVDDDPTTCDVVRAYLEREGYRVVVCRSGAEALDVARQTAARCLVLDVMLPGRDGFSICEEIRRRGSTVPILMLSARADEPDRVVGLRIGADDYLVKPFSPGELVARVAALLRRAEIGPLPPTALRLGQLELQLDRHEVLADGRSLELTHFEFAMVAALLEQPGRVLSRGQLIDRLYRGDGMPVLERSVDVHVARIREKLRAARAGAAIVTVRSVGYKMTAAEAPRR